MAKVKIEGVPPLDGEYEFDSGSFTNRELHLIKKHTGLLVEDFDDALGRDPDLPLGFAIVAVRKSGKFGRELSQEVIDLLFDSDVGKITLDFSDELAAAQEQEAKERPPDSPTTSGETNAPVVDTGETEKPSSSGPASVSDGDHQETSPSPTGKPGSDTSPTSESETSVISLPTSSTVATTSPEPERSSGERRSPAEAVGQ